MRSEEGKGVWSHEFISQAFLYPVRNSPGAGCNRVQHLWEQCRRATSSPTNAACLASLSKCLVPGVFGSTRSIPLCTTLGPTFLFWNAFSRLGVTFLAVLVGLQAIDNLLSLLLALGSGNVAGIVIIGILVAATIAVVVGLWRLRPWAFWTAIVVEVFYLLIAPLNLAQSTSPAILIERVIVEIVIPLVVLICLLAVRNVRAAIRGR